MSYINDSKISKRNLNQLFFLLTTFVLVVFLVVLSIFDRSFYEVSRVSFPVVVPDVVIQTQLYSNLPVTFVEPLIQVESSIKVVHEKTDTTVSQDLQDKDAEGKSEMRLKILKIDVDAVVKETGLTKEGAMAVPGNRFDAGWFSLGTRPGEEGTAVIGGHNRFDSGAGVFERLDQLEKGDVMSLVDAKGITTSFVVWDIKTYDATDGNTGIFESESGSHLNLITCSGDWDPVTMSYTKRLVIFTDVVFATNQIAMVPTQIQ